MAKTAIVNPRRRKAPKKRRRSNPSVRRYGSARRRRTTTRRRRRNPGSAPTSVYSSGGYRKSNPDFFDVDHILGVMPAATGGIWAVRWALKMAGPFEAEQYTTPGGKTAMGSVPGIKHAIAGVIAARAGSGMIAQLMGDASKAQYAETAALGFLGDLFLRTRLLAGSEWVAANLMLQGVDDDGADYETQDYYDAPEMGQTDAPQMYVGPDGTLYQLGADGQLHGLQDQSALGALQPTSALAGAPSRPSVNNSFGYA